MVRVAFVLCWFSWYLPVGYVEAEERGAPEGTLLARVQRMVDQDPKRSGNGIRQLYTVIADHNKYTGHAPPLPETDPADIQAQVLEISGPQADPESSRMVWRLRYEFDVAEWAVNRVFVGAIAFRPPVGHDITSEQTARTFVPVDEVMASAGQMTPTMVRERCVTAIVEKSGRSRILVALLAYDAKTDRMLVLAAKYVERSVDKSESRS